jgi:hypothetical protein
LKPQHREHDFSVRRRKRPDLAEPFTAEEII